MAHRIVKTSCGSVQGARCRISKVRAEICSLATANVFGTVMLRTIRVDLWIDRATCTPRSARVAQIFERRPDRFRRYAASFAERAVKQRASAKCHRYLHAGLYNFECRSDHLHCAAIIRSTPGFARPEATVGTSSASLAARGNHIGWKRAHVCCSFAGGNRELRSPAQRDGAQGSPGPCTGRPHRDAEGGLRVDRASHSGWPS